MKSASINYYHNVYKNKTNFKMTILKTNYIGKNMFFLSGNYIIKDVQSRDDAIDDKDQLRNDVQMVH